MSETKVPFPATEATLLSWQNSELVTNLSQKIIDKCITDIKVGAQSGAFAVDVNFGTIVAESGLVTAAKYAAIDAAILSLKDSGYNITHKRSVVDSAPEVACKIEWSK